MSAVAKILMLYTGGTIGMIKDRFGTLQPFEFENLLLQIPELNQLHCQIDTDSLDAPIDSSNMGPNHWQRLAKRIAEGYHQYDGFVVLHGSDTMAYTASALSFMFHNLSKPVILTGSQLPIGIPRSDARENLLTAIDIALAKNAEGGARVPEVAVYFEYDLMRGNRLHKRSTQDFEAFESMNYPKLAEAGVRIKYHDNYIARSSPGPFQLDLPLDTSVGILSAFPGMQSHFALPVLENPALKAILYRTFGSGNSPDAPWLMKGIGQFIERGGTVINITQCEGGGVFQGQYASSRALLEMGVLSAQDMTMEAAISKLMHLLPKGLERQAFKEKYERNLKGELSEQKASEYH